jgi:hypothetical protein
MLDNTKPSLEISGFLLDSVDSVERVLNLHFVRAHDPIAWMDPSGWAIQVSQ